MKKFIFIFSIAIILWFNFFSCSNSSEPTYNPLDEESNIPWSKLSGKIAYVRDYNNYPPRSYLVVLDASTKKISVINYLESTSFTFLAWNSDTNKIMSSIYDGYYWTLVNINQDGSNFVVYILLEAHTDFPCWSKSGMLAYWVNGYGSNPSDPNLNEIWINNQPFIRKQNCAQSRAALSPDGSIMIFAKSDSTSQGALYKVNTNDSTSVTPFLSGSGYDSQSYSIEAFSDPLFSPDGTKLAYVRYGTAISGQAEIWICDSDGKNKKRITNSSYDMYPAWSPDGSKILFSRTDNTDSRLYIVNIDGSDLTQVTSNAGRYPTWR